MLTQVVQLLKYIKSSFFTTTGVGGHASPENFEIVMLWNAISSFLRGQILAKIFSKSIVIFMLIYVTSRRSTRFYFKSLAVFESFFGYHFQLSILCHVWCHCLSIIRNSFENLRTDAKIVIAFSYRCMPIAYWSGFGIQSQAKSEESRQVLDFNG